MLSCDTAGATIYYKLNGSTTYTIYTGKPIVLTETTTLEVRSSLNNILSESVTYTYTKVAGVTVSGTITSYGDAGENVTVQLIEAGHTEPAYEAIVSGNSATYSFDTVPAGTYTLKVEKKGHAPFTKEITVGDSNVTADVTMYLIGDVNRDGKIDATDMQRIYAHISGENTFSNSAQGDVNEDGKVDATDMQRIYAHISGENPLS